MAVNCFETEPMSTTVSTVIGSNGSRRAAPYASAKTTVPSRPTATVQPGSPALSFLNRLRVNSAAATSPSVSTVPIVAAVVVGVVVDSIGCETFTLTRRVRATLTDTTGECHEGRSDREPTSAPPTQMRHDRPVARVTAAAHRFNRRLRPPITR